MPMKTPLWAGAFRTLLDAGPRRAPLCRFTPRSLHTRIIRPRQLLTPTRLRRPGRPYSTETPQKPAEPTSLSARLKKLSREYGWSALGVYFALSALDFPFCFLAVRLLGTDRIGRWEESIVRSAKNMLGTVVPAWGVQRAEGWRSREVEEAQAENAGANASIWTQLALAYAIHKSFIFIRVPLTAAVTPKVVRVLRGWGWDIGKRRPKAG